MPVPAGTVEALTDVVCYIAWQPRGTMWGGRHREDALEALAHITGIPVRKLEEIAGVDEAPDRGDE